MPDQEDSFRRFLTTREAQSAPLWQLAMLADIEPPKPLSERAYKGLLRAVQSARPASGVRRAVTEK